MKTVIAEVRHERLTIGLDLGDKSSAYCVLDGSGEVVSEHKVRTTPKALSDCFSGMAISRTHRSAQAQADLSLIRARAALV